MIYEFMVNQEDRKSRESAIAENSARRARSVHYLRSTGVGQVRLTEQLMFPVRFLEEPAFLQGSGVITQPNPASYLDPVGSAGVRSWVRNMDGHYLGALVFLRAELWTPFGTLQTQALPPGETPVSLVHYLMFEGLAYKHVGDGVVAAALTLEPRPVGYGGVD